MVNSMWDMVKDLKTVCSIWYIVYGEKRETTGFVIYEKGVEFGNQDRSREKN